MSLGCNRCSGTGWIVAIDKEYKAHYGFKCQCPRANGLSNHIPIWQDRLARHFEVSFLKEGPPKSPDFKAKAANPNDFNELDIPW